MTFLSHSETPSPFRGETVWKGTVEVFSVSNPPPERAYGWAVDGDYVAVLGNPPVDSPIAAVRAWLVSESKE